MSWNILGCAAAILLCSCAQAPQARPNWDNIEARNSAAFDRRNKEVIACKPAQYDQVARELQDRASHPNIVWNGSDFANTQLDPALERHWEELVNEWQKCQIEADARLKQQLWSP